MSTYKSAVAAVLCVMPILCLAQQTPNLGRQLTPEEVRKIDITITPDGRGLPPGRGSVSQGAVIYGQKCEGCHGARGTGKPQDALTGGVGSLGTAKPTKTAASFWPRATTLFDYIRRAMPLPSPQSLSNDEVYALTAYLLSIDNIVPADAVLDAKSLPEVKMPNRDGFVRYYPTPR
jgi:S-disulfanyl-L-cysteine oxidoreductase SoxD